jgi:hypothetical protein
MNILMIYEKDFFPGRGDAYEKRIVEEETLQYITCNRVASATKISTHESNLSFRLAAFAKFSCPATPTPRDGDNSRLHLILPLETPHSSQLSSFPGLN